MVDLLVRIPEQLKDIKKKRKKENQEALGQREWIEARFITLVAFVVMTASG